MKKLFAVLTVLALIQSCGTGPGNERGIVVGDTISTASGLKYYYTKVGNGPQVQTGSKVWTYLALSVDGKGEVWNTNDSPDSAFVFVANKDRMIKGFTEVTMFLHEGDEIVAILPPDLAYGERGSAPVIPPNATLVYTKYKMMRVNAPKLSLSDTLFAAYKNGGYEAMTAARQRIMSSADTANYYYEAGQNRLLWNLLTDDSMHNEAIVVASEAELPYLRVRSYYNLGQFRQALDSLEALFKRDTTFNSNSRATQLRDELKGKLKTN